MKTLIFAILLFYSYDIHACDSSKEFRICDKQCGIKKSITDYFDCAQECKDTYCIDDYEAESDSLSVERNIDVSRTKKRNIGS